MTNQEYRKKEGISSSDFRLLELSPLHYYHKEYFQLDGEVFTFGSLVHTLVLEPEKFEDEYKILPKFNLRTKQGKSDKEQFENENKSKTIIDEEQYKTAIQMAKNIKLISGGLLKNGIAEESFFTTDELGLKRKCRPDYYIEDLGLVIDIKTTKSSNDYEFSKTILDYSYHRQAAFYLDTLKLCGKKAKSFIIIAVEKNPPYLVRIFELDKEALAIGKDNFLKLLINYKEFLEFGKAKVINKINLPQWAIKQYQYEEII